MDLKKILKKVINEREDKERYEWAENVINTFIRGLKEKGKNIIQKPNEKILNVEGEDIDQSIENIAFSFQEYDIQNIASYWYDKSNNRYVIILRLLKNFEKEDLASEVEEKLQTWKPQIVHEITHLYDDMASGQKMEDPPLGGGKDYYLSNPEVNAYFMEAVATFENFAEKDAGKIPMGVTDNFEVFQDWMMDTAFSPDFKKYMKDDQETKRKVLKRLYQYWQKNVEGEIFV